MVVKYGLYALVGIIVAAVGLYAVPQRPMSGIVAYFGGAWAGDADGRRHDRPDGDVSASRPNIALLLKSGVPMLETLQTLVGIYQNNPIYREALTRARLRVAAGRPLAAALEETGLFSSMILNMVRTGEESGQLAQVMEQVAPYYKEKMEAAILKVTKMLEPIIIMGMGSTIAGLMLAIYMPMFEMAGKVN